MLNVLIPIAGRSKYFPAEEYPFPKPLIEIHQTTIIERVIRNLSQLADEINFTFVVNKSDCTKFHLDNTLDLLTNGTCNIVKLDGETKGAACSALMAIDHINTNVPLIIANADQLFELSLTEMIKNFDSYDAGVPVFTSVHPRWSFARVDEDNFVTETAEKRPLSKHAIAGLYYFSKGQLFIEAAMRSIAKDAQVNGRFFIAPVLNEMILKGYRVRAVKIPSEKFHTFYTPQKIAEYEQDIASRGHESQ